MIAFIFLQRASMCCIKKKVKEQQMSLNIKQKQGAEKKT
jgi:hypothetical protein